MAALKNLRVLPGGKINGLQTPAVYRSMERIFVRPPAGPALVLGGCTYAAAYLLLGFSGFTAWSGLLAVAGTVLILFGLRRTWERS